MSDLVVDVGPARFRNHITKKVRFVCRAELDAVREEALKEREILRHGTRIIQGKIEARTRTLTRKEERLVKTIEGKKLQLLGLQQQITSQRLGPEWDWPVVPTDKQVVTERGDAFPVACGAPVCFFCLHGAASRSD